MNSMWFAGLLPFLMVAAPAQAEGSKPADGVPAPSNIRGAQYPRIHRRPARDLPHQGAGRPEGRLRVL